MKLYELNRGDLFQLEGSFEMSYSEYRPGDVFKLHNIDGMYSYVTKVATEEVYHFAAWTEVTKYDSE